MSVPDLGAFPPIHRAAPGAFTLKARREQPRRGPGQTIRRTRCIVSCCTVSCCIVLSYCTVSCCTVSCCTVSCSRTATEGCNELVSRWKDKARRGCRGSSCARPFVRRCRGGPLRVDTPGYSVETQPERISPRHVPEHLVPADVTRPVSRRSMTEEPAPPRNRRRPPSSARSIRWPPERQEAS
jgi:hypothetical protein